MVPGLIMIGMEAPQPVLAQAAAARTGLAAMAAMAYMAAVAAAQPALARQIW